MGAADAAAAADDDDDHMSADDDDDGDDDDDDLRMGADDDDDLHVSNMSDAVLDDVGIISPLHGRRGIFLEWQQLRTGKSGEI